MSSQLNYAVFDSKDTDGLIAFLAMVTEHGPFCFRQAETDEDCVVVIYGPEPISQKAADSFYQMIVAGETP